MSLAESSSLELRGGVGARLEFASARDRWDSLLLTSLQRKKKVVIITRRLFIHITLKQADFTHDFVLHFYMIRLAIYAMKMN